MNVSFVGWPESTLMQRKNAWIQGHKLKADEKKRHAIRVSRLERDGTVERKRFERKDLWKVVV